MTNYFTLEHLGNFQTIVVDVDDKPYVSCPLTVSEADANRLIAWLGFPELNALFVGHRGSNEMKDVVDESITAGCEAMSVVSGWDREGTPIWCMEPIQAERRAECYQHAN